MPAGNAHGLNVFQRLIRQWDTIHPYNAAQVMRLAGVPDLQRIIAAWDNASNLVPLNIECAAVMLISPDVSLEAHLSTEIDRPFNPDCDDPFRPFVLNENDGSFWMGVVYQHRIADSVSIRMLLREWMRALLDPTSARREQFKLARTGYWRRFNPERAGWDLIDGVIGSMSWAANMRRVRRVTRPDVDAPTTLFALNRLPAGIVPRLQTYARRMRVTMNDIFLTAIARVADRHIAHARSFRRYEVAVGTIVDLRKPRDEDFGLFLGFTSVVCPKHRLKNWRALLDTISRQNNRHKITGMAPASMMRMSIGLMMGRLLSPQRLLDWYYKRLPLSAGISNVNLNRTWVGQLHPSAIREYIRVSPVGPMLPVVFTPSTLGDDMNFGLTFRESTVTRPVANAVAKDFSDQLIALASGREP